MNNYILAGLLILIVQSKSQVPKTDPYRFLTVPYDYDEDQQENVRDEVDKEVQFSRRADVRLPIIVRRYPAEANPAYREQQQAESTAENYPYQLVHQFQNARFNRFRINPSNKKPQPSVEQYLKEVTPTTKTTYNLRFSGQSRNNNHKQQSLQESRSALKESPFQYVLQPDFEQIPSHQERGQVSYQKPQEVRMPPNPEIHASNLVAHQNALLAEQNTLYEQQQRLVHNVGIDGKESSRSAIYVSQKIPKKPVVRKLNKPKVISTNEDDTDYYARLLEYQRQQQETRQQEQQKQPVSEPKEPAPVRYQARLPQAAPYDLEQAQQLSKYQEALQYQQPQQLAMRYERPAKPNQLPRQPSYQAQPTARYQEAIKYQQAIQDQQEQYSRGVKPVEENAEQPYQQPIDNNQLGYQKVTEEALAKYRAALAKFQELVNNREVEGAEQKQYEYQQPESAHQGYQQQPQYSEQNYQPAQEQPVKLYKATDLEQTLRNREAGVPERVPAHLSYRQNAKNSNARYYRNYSGRPTVVYATTE